MPQYIASMHTDLILLSKTTENVRSVSKVSMVCIGTTVTPESAGKHTSISILKFYDADIYEYI